MLPPRVLALTPAKLVRLESLRNIHHRDNEASHSREGMKTRTHHDSAVDQPENTMASAKGKKRVHEPTPFPEYVLF